MCRRFRIVSILHVTVRTLLLEKHPKSYGKHKHGDINQLRIRQHCYNSSTPPSTAVDCTGREISSALTECWTSSNSVQHSTVDIYQQTQHACNKKGLTKAQRVGRQGGSRFRKNSIDITLLWWKQVHIKLLLVASRITCFHSCQQKIQMLKQPSEIRVSGSLFAGLGCAVVFVIGFLNIHTWSMNQSLNVSICNSVPVLCTINWHANHWSNFTLRRKLEQK